MNAEWPERALLLVAPLRAGKAEAWRRFCQGLAPLAAGEHADRHCAFGIDDQQVWLLHTAYGELAMIAITATEPREALLALASSAAPFDRWLNAQLIDLCGLELARPLLSFPAELLFARRGGGAVGP